MHSMVSLCLVVVLMQGGDLSSIHMEWAWCKPLSRNFAPFPLVQAPHSSLLHPPTIRLQVVLLDIMVHLLLPKRVQLHIGRGNILRIPVLPMLRELPRPLVVNRHTNGQSLVLQVGRNNKGAVLSQVNLQFKMCQAHRDLILGIGIQITGPDHIETSSEVDCYYFSKSDELLLQEDNYDVGSLSTEFSKGVNLSSGNQPGTVRRSNHQSNPSSYSLVQRQNGFVQSFSHVNVGSPPSAHELHAGSYGHSMSKPSHFTPHLPQNSPRRLGQQASHRGRRANYPGPSIPPASRGRKDHGRFV
ncbi:unnamed protein product [Linum tenue]|uniref:Uncharacterized protein n=1 Tax=Linum tenue TaxID=586396 RepID=A0AAV0I115_9ROSI|nr:unnamed protein product [Linum tenue]